MTWFNIGNGPLPGEQEIVEIQLINGGVQLARFADGTWRVPTIDGSAALNRAEIKNAVKWRLFKEVLAAYRTKKIAFKVRPDFW